MKRLALAVVLLSAMAVWAKERLVVANFRSATGDSIWWNGKAESSAMWTATLADKINQRLTRTHVFTMIDRKFDAEVQDEIARLSDKNAAKADVVRLSQRLGTDYLLVGEVRFAPSHQPQSVVANPVTGQAMPTAAAPQCFAELSYRLVHAPTGEIREANTERLSYGEFNVADLFSFVSATTDAASLLISESIMAGLGKAAAPVACPAAAPTATPAACPARPAAPAAEPLNTTVRGTGNGGVVTPF